MSKDNIWRGATPAEHATILAETVLGQPPHTKEVNRHLDTAEWLRLTSACRTQSSRHWMWPKRRS